MDAWSGRHIYWGGEWGYLQWIRQYPTPTSRCSVRWCVCRGQSTTARMGHGEWSPPLSHTPLVTQRLNVSSQRIFSPRFLIMSRHLFLSLGEWWEEGCSRNGVFGAINRTSVRCQQCALHWSRIDMESWEFLGTQLVPDEEENVWIGFWSQSDVCVGRFVPERYITLHPRIPLFDHLTSLFRTYMHVLYFRTHWITPTNTPSHPINTPSNTPSTTKDDKKPLTHHLPPSTTKDGKKKTRRGSVSLSQALNEADDAGDGEQDDLAMSEEKSPGKPGTPGKDSLSKVDNVLWMTRMNILSHGFHDTNTPSHPSHPPFHPSHTLMH